MKTTINMLQNKKIVTLIVLLTIQNSLFSQGIDSIFLKPQKQELNKYKYIANLELKKRYDDSAKIKKEDDKFDEYVNWYYNYSDLKVYSTPIFKLKLNKKQNCKEFIKLINFESHPNYQRVYVEANNKIVSDFMVHPSSIFQNLKFSLDLFFRKYDYDSNNMDIPLILGDLGYSYFVKERFEKEYFSFLIEGFKGTFIIKNNKLFYVIKKMNYEGNKNKLTVLEIETLSKTYFIEVNDNFFNEIKNEYFKDKKIKKIIKRCSCK